VESHRLCNVNLALRGPKDAWLLLLPAVCHVPVADAFVHVLPNGARPSIYVGRNPMTEARPRLEFPVLDYIAIEDKLEPPITMLFGPAHLERGFSSLGYRSECIYSDEDPRPIAQEFIRKSVGVDYAPDVAQEVLELIRRRARPGRILVVDLVPHPPHEEQPGFAAPGGGDGYGGYGSAMEGEDEALVPGPGF